VSKDVPHKVPGNQTRIPVDNTVGECGASRRGRGPDEEGRVLETPYENPSVSVQRGKEGLHMIRFGIDIRKFRLAMMRLGTRGLLSMECVLERHGSCIGLMECWCSCHGLDNRSEAIWRRLN
jgi:hypothetical protein